MSLLNDMLKDLDNQREQGKHTDRAPALQAQGKLKTWLLPGLAALAVVYWLVIEMNLIGLMPEAGETGLPSGYELNTNWSERLKAERQQVAEQEVTAPKVAAATGALDAPASMVASDQTAQSSQTNAMDATAQPTLAPHTDQSAQPTASTPFADAPLTAAAQPQTPLAQAVNAQVPQIDGSPTAPVTEPKFAPQPRQAEPSTALPAANNISEPKLPIQRTDAGHDRNYANAIDEGRYDLVAGDAYGWLKNGSPIDHTSIALIKHHFAKGNSAELTQVAALVQPQSADLAAFAEAHWLALAGRVSDAIAVAERAALPAAVDAERIRLLAALHQLSGNHGQAHRLFTQLIRTPRATVNDWLGFAVASDKQGLVDSARQGFAQVLQLQHPDPNVLRYANQRYRQLTP